MEVNINLKSKSWYSNENVYAIGFLIDGAGIHKQKRLCEKILKYKDDLHHIKSGEFAAIIIEEDSITLLVDSIRSIPLFYKIKNDAIDISDESYQIRIKHKASLDLNAAKTFLHSGFVHDRYTLGKDIYQVEAGSSVAIKDKTVSIYDYSRKKVVELKSKTPDELLAILSEVFDDYITILNGRQAVVSLSGGFDSRLILAMLHLKKYKHIACISYGRSNLKELQNAKQVAHKLGYPWLYINYDEIFDPKIILQESFSQYCRYASNDVSMFYLQDYFAISHIRENKLIDSDAVIIPGHTGDVISGGHLSSDMKSIDFNAQALSKKIIDLHFDFHQNKSNNSSIISKSVMDTRSHIPWLGYERWERMNRQAKFVINSKRVYDFFNYESLVPLWDKRLIDFFRSLPFAQKYNSKLYRNTLKELIFRPLRINMPSETQPNSTQILKQQVKDQVKRIAPKFLINQFVNYDDPYCYATTIDAMRSTGFEFVLPRQKNIWNAYLVQWYLHKEYDLSYSEIKEMINQ